MCRLNLECGRALGPNKKVGRDDKESTRSQKRQYRHLLGPYSLFAWPAFRGKTEEPADDLVPTFQAHNESQQKACCHAGH